MNEQQDIFIRSNKVLLFSFLFVLCVYFAKEFLIPITISALLSFLFLPVETWLNKSGLPRILSILVCVLLVLIFVFGLIFLFYYEMSDFLDQLPQLQAHAQQKATKFVHFIETETKFSSKKQMALLDQLLNYFTKGLWIRNAFQITGNLFLTFGLILVYIFCFLFYKDKIKDFSLKIYQDHGKENADITFKKIKKVSHNYFSGMLIVMAILGTMHTIGLLLLGIPNAAFLGYLASLFILAPVVGTMIGSTIPFMVALLTKDSAWYAVGVAGIFSFNLFMESQILTPMIVGSNIKINPMAIIVTIVIGSLVWGILGMVLFVPLLGMFKIITDDTGYFPSLNILISDTSEHKQLHLIRRVKDFLHWNKL